MSTLYAVAAERAKAYLELPEELPSRPAGSHATLTAGRLGTEWEHNHEWKTPTRRARLISKMLRTSPILALAEELITGRVTSVRLTVKRNADTSEEAAEAMEAWLGLGKYEDAGGRMSMSTDELIRHLMSARAYGHVALSESWEYDDEAGLYWCDLHRRQQASYYAYLTEAKSQKLLGIVQSTGYGISQAVLPIAQTLFLVSRPDLGWFDGRSMLRSCYPHWRSQQLRYRLEDLAANRYAMPPAQGKLVLDRFVQYANGAGGTTPTREDFQAELADMASKLTGLDSDDNSHLLYPDYWTFEQRASQHSFDPGPLLESASHHERCMAEKLAVSFVMQGRRGDGGSRSMVETQAVTAQDAVIDSTQWLLNALNRQTVKRWLDVNFSTLTREERPIVSFERASIKTPFWMSNPGAFADFVSNQILTVSPADEAAIRAASDLPPPPDDLPDALDRKASQAGGRLKVPAGQREAERPGDSKRTKNRFVNRLVEREPEE
tara:strand:- start:349 stop:1827 length:1479 start_codon:yes stop_codon:yes gene_type:complete